MSSQSTSRRERIVNSLLAKLGRISPRMAHVNMGCILVGLALAVTTLVFMDRLLSLHTIIDETNRAFENCQAAATKLMETSDFLTEQARSYVNTGKQQYLDSYLGEIETYDHRGKSIAVLQKLAHNDEATTALQKSMEQSDRLSEVELYALRLAAEHYGVSTLPTALSKVRLSSEDSQLSSQEKHGLAYQMVYGDDYTSQKLTIRQQAQECSALLIESLSEEQNLISDEQSFLVSAMRITVVALLLVVVFGMLSTTYLLLWPMSLDADHIRKNQPLDLMGARELRYLTQAYNDMYEKNHQETESLQYEARYDALTGVLNRGSYDELLPKHRTSSALVLVDIDRFKRFNDDFGHDMGDAVLIEVAATLYGSFRTTDFVCRIGGDEFAVIAPDLDATMQDVIEGKIQKVAAFLRDTSNGLPSVTISVGVAFGHMGLSEDALFKAADAALYETKRRGRDGYTFAQA